MEQIKYLLTNSLFLTGLSLVTVPVVCCIIIIGYRAVRGLKIALKDKIINQITWSVVGFITLTVFCLTVAIINNFF